MANNTIENKPFQIWEGIYDSFQSAAAEALGAGFGGEIYRERSLLAAKECLAALKSRKPIPQFHKQHGTLLPLTVAMMLSKNEIVKILDFGGGLGIGYMTLSESIPNDINSTKYNC